MNRSVFQAVIILLLIVNAVIFTIIFSSGKESTKEKRVVHTGSETVEAVSSNLNSTIVATVGEMNITETAWLEKLKEMHGQKVLKEMINRQVVTLLAEKHNITIDEETIERELLLIRTMYQHGIDGGALNNDSAWKDEIRYQLLFEELLTQDVQIPEEQLKEFYTENHSLFNIEETYHFSHIVVTTEKEGLDITSELENGSNFSVLAMERSIDEFSANQGGDLGYVSVSNTHLPAEYFETLRSMEVGKWSLPIPIDKGYALLYLNEKIKGTDYSFKEVKGQLRRQLAMQQLRGQISAEVFWKEIGVEWVYSKK